VRQCIADNSVGKLRAVAAKNEGSPRPSDFNEEDPFYWGVTAVCGMDGPITRQRRWTMGNELAYAHKHDVPPELLIGFLYQIGKSDGLRDRLLRNELEEWCEAKTEKGMKSAPSGKRKAE